MKILPLPRATTVAILGVCCAIAPLRVLAAQCIPTPPGTIGWWPGDGDARDFVGMSHGTFVNGATTAAGLVGQAFAFNDMYQYVNTGAVAPFDFERTAAFSGEAWVNLTGSSKQAIFGKLVSGPSVRGWAFNISQGVPDRRLFLLLSSSGDLRIGVRATTPLSLGAWHHVAFTYDGSSTAAGVKIYLDGEPQSVTVEIDTLTDSMRNGTGLQIGSNGIGTSDFFSGLIDEAAVYGRELSAGEIAGIHAAGSAGKCKPDSAVPVANAGLDQAIHAGNTVHLDGGDSLDETTSTSLLGYDWTLTEKPAGSAATLVGADTQTPSFFADLPGEYLVTLVVTDEANNASVPDEVVVSSNNVTPTAGIFFETVVFDGNSTDLDATLSFDPDADPLTYRWTLVSRPAGSSSVLSSGSGAITTLLIDVPGEFVVDLVVNDGFTDSAPAQVTITGASTADYVQARMEEGSRWVASLPVSSFDSKGHRNSMQNQMAQIAKLTREGERDDARSHLVKLIERTDGAPLMRGIDPKGGGQINTADFLVDPMAQSVFYRILTDALGAL